MFFYCPQCGLISSATTATCPVCSETMEPVPPNYLSAGGNLFCSADARKAFVREVVETSVRYRPELAHQKDYILAEKKKSREKTVEALAEAYQQSKPVHRCPVCTSQNLTKLSNIGKAAKIALIGVWGAGDLGKQWRCNSCGYKF